MSRRSRGAGLVLDQCLPLEANVDEKVRSILKQGKDSPYWEEFARGLPWDKESAETKLYLAGTLSGFSPDYVLRVVGEQAFKHGTNFQNQGFFMWVSFFDAEKRKGLSYDIDARKTVVKVRAISLYDYERVARSEPDRFRGVFFENGELDSEFLRAIHFNATRSMSTAEVEIGAEMDAFIKGTLIGCMSAGKDEVIKTNQRIEANHHD